MFLLLPTRDACISACVASDATSKADPAGKRLDLVHLRDVLESIAARESKEPLLEMALSLLTQCEERIEEQAYEIALLRKHAFGRRSEKVADDQLALFSDLLQAVTEIAASSTDAPAAESSTAAEEPAPKSRRTPQKRRPLVPTQQITLDVPSEKRACPECGGERMTIGRERSLVIEFVPPKIEVIEYLREKIACKPCGGELRRAAVPEERVVERAAPGPRMLAALAVHKHVDGLPLHRIRRLFARAGVDLAVQTLNRWEAFGQQLAAPIARRIRELVLASDTINLDDTGLRVRDETSEHGAWRGHIWVFVGRRFDPGGDLSKTLEQVHYLYAPTWHAKYPEQFLAKCSAVLQGDAYRGYDRISAPHEGEPVKNVLAGCAMHARRPFVRAFELRDSLALPFVQGFKEIYRIEAQAKQDSLLAHERLELRKTQSLPILAQLRSRAHDLAPLPLSQPMREGVRYLENQWEKLRVPFEIDGRLEIDNGAAERRLRRLAAGRRSWLFAGSTSGAERIAQMLSLVSTADAASVDPGAYLTDAFSKIAHGWPNNRLDELLPHRWAPSA
jgi:transposase